MYKDHMSPITPDELVRQMREDYKAFFTTCQALTESQSMEPGVCGAWSAKAVVDHLTGWQVQSLSIITALLAEEKTAFDLDIDKFNQISVNERQKLSWQESQKAFDDSFNAFIDGLDEIPESHFQNEEGLIAWVKAMIHEYKFHLKHIQKALTI